MRQWIFAFALVSLVLTGVFAGGAAEQKAAASGPVQVTVWYGSWYADQAPVIAAEYKKFKPNVELKIETLPINGYIEKAMTATLGGTPPDVLDLDAFMIAGMAGKNLLMPWDEYIKNLDVKDFAQAIWSAGVLNGKVYAIPNRGSSTVVYYNKTMFDKAGLSYPTEDWTYPDMLQMAQKITKPGEQYGVGIAAAISDPANVMTSFAPIVWAMGGDFLSADFTSCVLNKPEGVKAIAYYSELYTKHKVAPEGTPNYSTTKDLVPMFINDKVAIIFSASQNIAQFEKEPKLKWGIEIPPGKSSGGGGWSYTVPVGAKQAAAARDFVFWFVDPPVLSRLAIREPARISATTSPPWNSDAFKVVMKSAKYSHVLPPIPQWNEIQTLIITELQKTLQQVKTPQQAADDIAAQTNALLQKK